MKYQSLKYFFTIYLNQDYDAIFGGVDEAILAYKVTEESSEREKIKHEIRELIESNLDEKNIQELIFDEMNCEFYFLVRWKTSRDWLAYILNVLEGVPPVSS